MVWVAVLIRPASHGAPHTKIPPPTTDPMIPIIHILRPVLSPLNAKAKPSTTKTPAATTVYPNWPVLIIDHRKFKTLLMSKGCAAEYPAVPFIK